MRVFPLGKTHLLDFGVELNYTSPMRHILLFILALSVCAQSARAEVVSVPVDVTMQVKEQNLFEARKEAVDKAFKTAVYRASMGILPAGGAAQEAELEERVLSRASDFVASYKFLSESIDYYKGTMTVNMEVTVYLDLIWENLKDVGARAIQRKGKKLVTLIHEESLSFLAKRDFLLLPSLSEEVVASEFRKNGFIVDDRKQVHQAGLGQLALRATEGDLEAAGKIGEALHADLVIVGKTLVKITKTSNGEKATAVIKAALCTAPDGDALAVRQEFSENESEDGSRGSLLAIQKTAQYLAREFLAVAGVTAAH
ncbi:MAG: hypothetical protein OEY50_00225 [Nitrospinota bacterium]|nr:hypothetical protein [Nitrospinota bacterium]